MTIESKIIRIIDEVNTQTDIINRIKTGLEGKAAGFGYTTDTIRGLFNRDIEEFKIPESVTNIPDYMFRRCNTLVIDELPDSIMTIGNFSFENCTVLNLPRLPAGLTEIGRSTFNQCHSLALTKLPEGLITLQDYSFNSCRELQITEIPIGVTVIKEYALSNCLKIVEITFKGKPSEISDKAFYNSYNIRTINVPWSEGEVANAPWGASNATINYNYTGEE